MRYTRTALGLLNAQYRSVLKKCFLINLGLFAFAYGTASAEEYTLNAEDLSASKNITWKEISAKDYDATNKNMFKIDLSADKSQYFVYSYTESGKVYNERKADLTGDITADFKDITSNVDGGALINTAGNTLNISGDFLNNRIDNSGSGNWGGAVINRGTLSLKGDMIGNNIVRDGYAFGGAIYSESNTANITEIIGNYIGNYIISNTDSAYGGAIFNFNGSEIGKIEGKFINNYTVSNLNDTTILGASGGAIYNGNSKIRSVFAEFINNHIKTNGSSAYGGAIYNVNGSEIGKIEGKFINNYTVGNLNDDTKIGASGGAILNQNSKIESVFAEFINNHISGNAAYGGAIYNYSSEISKIEGKFINNYAVGNLNDADKIVAIGGAIYNKNSKIESVFAEFINNHIEADGSGVNSGAILNEEGTIDNITGDFIGNYALSENYRAEGGAILNLKSTIKGIKGDFIKNYAIGGKRTSGGAVNNNDASVINSIIGSFYNNHTESNGGASETRGGALINFGKITELTGNFDNNYALTNGTFSIGGAIANIYGNENSIGIGKLSGNFSNNYAKTTGSGSNAYAQGGAIYNNNSAVISNIQSSNFSNNYVSGADAKTDGGAIWNAGKISFSGNNAFKDNYKIVNGVKTANDIYNSGTVNVTENSSLSVSGGITGNGNGQINLAENAALNLNDATSSGNNITLEKDATLAFNVNKIKTSDTEQSGGKFDGDIKLNADSNLNVSTYVEHGVVSGEGTYKFANNVDTANGQWKLNTIISNSLYNYEFKLNDDNNTLTLDFSKKNANEIAEEFDIGKDKADEILAITNQKGNNEQFNNISESVNKQAQAGDRNLPRALNDLNDNTQANLETGRYLGDIITKNVAYRLNPRHNKGGIYGLSGGDVSEYEPEVWTNVVYQSAKNNGDLDYSADTGGVVAAVDGKVNKNWTIGAGYAYLQTDLDSGSKSSDIDDHSVFAYTEYNRNSWFVNGLASYHWMNFEQNKEAFGENIKGSFDMQMLGLQTLAGREFYGCAENHILRLRPQAGLRYFKISDNGYTDSAGISYNDADSNVLTGVLGVYLTDETEVNGYKVTPEAFVNATYDLQNDDNTTIVSLPNGSSYTVAQESNGKLGVETGIGVEVAVSDNAKIGLTYSFDWRDDYSAHTGLLNLKYAF